MHKKLGGKIEKFILALVYSPVYVALFCLAFTLFSLVILAGLLICIYEDFKRSDFVAKLLGL